MRDDRAADDDGVDAREEFEIRCAVQLSQVIIRCRSTTNIAAAAALWRVLALRNIEPLVTVHASADAALCLVLRSTDADALARVVRDPEVAADLVWDLAVTSGAAMISLTRKAGGSGHLDAARLYAALGRGHVNVLASSQDTARAWIRCCISEADLGAAERLLAQEFGSAARWIA